MSQSSNSKVDLAALFDKALSLQHQGSYEEAIHEYQRLLGELPSHKPSLLNMGAIYYVKSSYDLALDYFLKVLEIDEKDVMANYNAGRTLQARKEWSKSLEFLKRASELDGTDLMILKSLGKSFFQLGFYEDSYQCYRSYLDQNHDDVESLMNFSESLVHLGQFELAMFGLKRVIDLDATQVKAYELLSECYAHSDRLEKAVATLNRVLHMRDDDPSIYRKLAMYYGTLNNFKEAKRCYIRAYGLESQEIKMHEVSERKRLSTDIDRVTFQSSILAITEKYSARNNWKGALQEFSQLSRRYPDSVILLQEIAYIYQVIGESKRSSSYYEKILRLDSGNLEAMLQLIRISIDLEDLEMGNEYLEMALKHHPETMEVRELGGLLHVHFHDYEKGLEYFDYCKEKGFDSCGVLLGSSQCYMGQGDFKKAIEILKRACKIFPDSIDLVLNLAKSYLETNDIKEARSLMNKARKTFHGNLAMYAMSVQVAIASRSYKKASEFYQKISDLVPTCREDNPDYILSLVVVRRLDDALRRLKAHTRFRLKTFEGLYLESVIYAAIRDKVKFSITWQEIWGEYPEQVAGLVHQIKTVLGKDDIDFMMQVQGEINRLYVRTPQLQKMIQEFYRTLSQPTQLEVVK